MNYKMEILLSHHLPKGTTRPFDRAFVLRETVEKYHFTASRGILMIKV